MKTPKNGIRLTVNRLGSPAPIINDPLISIITVVYNGKSHLEQAILSIINQSYKNIEYIIIDGGSTDGTLDIIRKYEAHVAYWCSEPDKGIFDAMNKGIEKATGEYIAFLNADDWYEDGILNEVVSQINRPSLNPSDKRVVYFNYYWWDEEFSTEIKNPRQCNLKYWRGMSILHQAMFVQKNVYRELGLYDINYTFASDYDYFLKMIKANVQFQKINQYGVNFRKGGASTQNMNRSISEVSGIVRKFFGRISKEYILFIFTNRFPSILGNIVIILCHIIGKSKTRKIRKFWRRLVGVKQEKVIDD